jgi:hypothetical protein
MKKRFTLLLASAAFAISSNAQIVFTENFTAPFTPTASGWEVQNNSVPIGTASWFQGNGGVLPSFNGGPNDYYGANFASQGTTSGGISNFLITPTFTNLTNGGIIQFYTRTSTGAPFADRLQLRLSTSGPVTAIAAGTTAVGNFTTLLVDINPTLASGAGSYPDTWTAYTATLSGITGTVSGRFAFRYFVNNGGTNGANSNYIGIDAVQYSLPCSQPVININPPSGSICSGAAPVNFFGSGATSYTWNTGATTSTLAVSPTLTTIYTLSGESTPGCIGSKTVAVTVTLTPNVSVLNYTTCASAPITLSPSGATNYSWNTGATTSSITVNPATTTNYTVTGTNGVSCSNTKTLSVTVGANLSVNIMASQTTLCAGGSVTLTASGAATTYSWNTGLTTAVIIVNPATTTTYSVSGINGACNGGNTITITTNTVPLVSIAASATAACTSPTTTITYTASGANSYLWTGGNTATINTVATPTVAGPYFVSLTGTSNGCSATVTVPLVVSPCTGIDAVVANVNSFAVYPNPFTSELTLKGFNGKVEIFNTLGQLVTVVTVKDEEVISTSDLAKGIYIIKAYDSNNKVIKTEKVIKH